MKELLSSRLYAVALCLCVHAASGCDGERCDFERSPIGLDDPLSDEQPFTIRDVMSVYGDVQFEAEIFWDQTRPEADRFVEAGGSLTPPRGSAVLEFRLDPAAYDPERVEATGRCSGFLTTHTALTMTIDDEVSVEDPEAWMLAASTTEVTAVGEFGVEALAPFVRIDFPDEHPEWRLGFATTLRENGVVEYANFSLRGKEEGAEESFDVQLLIAETDRRSSFRAHQ
jgi:hypothetical protein